MANHIKLSHMSHWKTIPYKQIDNFRDYYYEGKSNSCYYVDWDRLLRYHKATGYDGIDAAALPMVHLTTVAQPRMEMAEKIIDILRRHAENADAAPEHYQAMPELVVRGSSACL